MTRSAGSSGKQRLRNVILLRALLLIAVGGLLIQSDTTSGRPAALALLLVFVLSDLALAFLPRRWLDRLPLELAVGAVDVVLVALGVFLSTVGGRVLPVSCLLMVLVVALGNRRIHAIAGAAAVSALHAWFVLGQAGSVEHAARQFALQILFLCSVGLYYGYLVEGVHRLRRLIEAERLSRRELATLLDILDAITSSLDLRFVTQSIVQRITAIVPATRCSILFIEQPSNKCYVLASHDDPDLDMLEIDLLKYPEVRHAIETRNSVVIQDVASDPLLADVRSLLQDLDFNSLMVIPLTFGDDVLGTLCLKAAKSERDFTERELHFCTAVARASANALKNALLHRQVREESRRHLRTGQQLASVLDHSPDLILTTDTRGRVTEFNRGAENTLGYRREVILESSCEMLFVGSDGAGLIERVLQEGSISNHSCQFKSADGSRIDLELNLAVLRDENDQPMGTVWIGRDISELKATHMQLLQAEKLSTIGEVISGVAHELNNPLSGVLGFSQLLMARNEASPLTGELEKIHDSALSCQKIVKNLLAFARGHQPTRRYLGVNGIIEKTLDLKNYQLSVKDIVIEVDLEPELPRTMLDFHQIQQVLLNLINNAEHAMSSLDGRSGRLVIRTSSHDGSIRIHVTDNGTGMDGRTLDRIFDPFFTTKAQGEGTGLGLSVSYGIIKEHGGSIQATSRLGEGTTFVIELPVRCDESGQDREIPARTQRTAAPAGSGTGRILIVDDEPMILDLMIDILTEAGHRIDSASNGAEACRKITSREYDLLITDMRMPRMSGMQLYEKVLAARPEMEGRIIFMSGDLIESDTVRFLEESGALSVAKPIDIPEVLETVGIALRKRGRGRPVPV